VLLLLANKRVLLLLAGEEDFLNRCKSEFKRHAHTLSRCRWQQSQTAEGGGGAGGDHIADTKNIKFAGGRVVVKTNTNTHITTSMSTEASMTTEPTHLRFLRDAFWEMGVSDDNVQVIYLDRTYSSLGAIVFSIGVE